MKKKLLSGAFILGILGLAAFGTVSSGADLAGYPVQHSITPGVTTLGYPVQH